jgi:hypothetical protein
VYDELIFGIGILLTACGQVDGLDIASMSVGVRDLAKQNSQLKAQVKDLLDQIKHKDTLIAR